MPNPTEPSGNAQDISLTFAKGMEVLKAFDDRHTHMTIAELSRRTGVDRAAVRRLVRTLVYLGYARQDGRRFSLTPRVLVLAGGFLRGRQFGKTIQPTLDLCAREVSESVSLAMADGLDAVYVAQATRDDSVVSIGFTIGSRLPLLHTSIGRALLAYGDPGWAARALAEAEIEAHTSRSLTDRAAIEAAVRAAAERGHAFVDGEFEPGVAGLSVPVGRRTRATSAIGFSASSERFVEEGYRAAALGRLRRCAAMLEELLTED